MADTNNERVGKALALLGEGLAPFVDRECGLVLGPTGRTPSKSMGPARRPTRSSCSRR